MVTHTVIVSDRSKDNITVYTKEPIFLAMADRNDLNVLRHLDEANKAGIYILLGENQRYVGQASDSVYARLNAHNKEKDWWNRVIFFGREDGRLDKSQTDYLEKKLIELFQKTDLTLENGTSGNTSFINKTNKIQADNVWNIAQEILNEIAHIEIFERYIELEEENQNGQIYIELDGKKIPGKNYQDNQKRFFLFLLKQPKYRALVEEFCANGKPTVSYCIGNEPAIRPNGMKYTFELEKGLHLYTHASTDARRKAIQHFADSVGLNIVFHWE